MGAVPGPPRIDPRDRRVDVARLPVDGTYTELVDLGPGDTITSPLLEGFGLGVDDLFAW